MAKLILIFILIWTYYTKRSIRKCHNVTSQVTSQVESHDDHGKVVHRLHSSCISSEQNPTETSLSSFY